MPIYEIEAPDGRILEIEGSQMPTESELNDIFKNTESIKQTDKPKGMNDGLIKNGARAIASGISMAKDGRTWDEAWEKSGEALEKMSQEHPVLADKIPRGLDFVAPFTLPELKLLQAGKFAPVANNLATGAYQGGIIGGLDGLSEGRGLEGAAQGAATGVALTAGLPAVFKGTAKMAEVRNNLADKILEGLSGATSKTRARAVQPDSVALDLSKDEAQNLLMDTTERVRNIYDQLVDKKGRQVGKLLEKLPDEATLNVNDILRGYSDILDNYSLSGNQALNPARNAVQKELREINSFFPTNDNATITAKELYDINKNVADMVRWDMPNSATKNAVLEQIYGQNAKRISDLSPALKAANKAYENLMNFKKNEGLNRILREGDVIDNAASALKNYNSTITKGNTNRNVQDLEKLFVDEGYEPFLNKIDDVNAAQNLQDIRVTGDSSLANVLRLVQRPGLHAQRAINRTTIPQKIENFKNFLSGLHEDRLITPALYGVPTVMLKGGVRYNELDE